MSRTPPRNSAGPTGLPSHRGGLIEAAATFSPMRQQWRSGAPAASPRPHNESLLRLHLHSSFVICISSLRIAPRRGRRFSIVPPREQFLPRSVLFRALFQPIISQLQIWVFTFVKSYPIVLSGMATSRPSFRRLHRCHPGPGVSNGEAAPSPLRPVRMSHHASHEPPFVLQMWQGRLGLAARAGRPCHILFRTCAVRVNRKQLPQQPTTFPCPDTPRLSVVDCC